MEKVRKEFRNMNEVINFLDTMEVEGIVEKLKEVAGLPDVFISNYEYFGNTYRKELYVSEIVLTPNFYDESFQALIRVKNGSTRLIVLIDYVKYDYGNESGEKAILKMAYN